MKFTRHAAPILVALLAPALAWAGEEAAGHDSGLAWHLVNLALILGVVLYFARTPIRTFMAERRQNIEAGIETATRELSEAERRLAECSERMASLEREVEAIRSAMRAQAEAERDRLLADARAAADRIRRDALAAVEQESRSASEHLRAEAAELAVRLAGDLLKRQVTDTDRTRLVDEFVQRVESAPPGAATRS